MSHNSEFEIRDDALLISDAHYNPFGREKLYETLKNTQATQIVFFGDIFDGLFGYIKHTHELNKKMIDLINELALTKEIVYLEGNHDFQIAHLFKNINYFTIEQQPIAVTYKNENALISHGDIYGSFGYKIFNRILRSSLFLFSYYLIDNYLLKNRMILREFQRMINKDLCRKIENFESIALKRVSSYNTNGIRYIIEGHYHQNVEYDFDGVRYINLPSFACID